MEIFWNIQVLSHVQKKKPTSKTEKYISFKLICKNNNMLVFVRLPVFY